jgi:ATP synthase protein I
MRAALQAPLSLRPIVRVTRWQALATLAVVVVAGLWAGGHAALSAALGGIVNIAAALVFAVVLAISRPSSAGGTVAALFRAEAGKVLVIVGQLYLVLTTYKEVVPAAFLASFVITVLLFRLALLDRD